MKSLLTIGLLVLGGIASADEVREFNHPLYTCTGNGVKVEYQSMPARIPPYLTVFADGLFVNKAKFTLVPTSAGDMVTATVKQEGSQTLTVTLLAPRTNGNNYSTVEFETYLIQTLSRPRPAHGERISIPEVWQMNSFTPVHCVGKHIPL
jgi:hypothetical protein